MFSFLSYVFSFVGELVSIICVTLDLCFSLCCVVNTFINYLFITYQVRISFSYIVTILIVGQTMERRQLDLETSSLGTCQLTSALDRLPLFTCLGSEQSFYFDCKVTFQNRLCCNCNICTFPC